MKTIRSVLNSLALAAMAGGAIASALAPSLRAHGGHAELAFREIETTYTYANGVVAVWTAQAQAPIAGQTLASSRVIYHLTLTGLEAGKYYSMVNLGLQYHGRPVTILSAENVVFADHQAVSSGSGGAEPEPSYVVKAVGLVVDDPNKPEEKRLNGDDVIFLSPTKTGLTVEIVAVPVGPGPIGVTNWVLPDGSQIHTGFRGSHDTIPAPGTPAK